MGEKITLSELCPSSVEYINPKVALKVSEPEWRFIVNIEDKYTQYIKIGICT